MKKLLMITACSLPLAVASTVYAQTTPPPATDTPATTQNDTGAAGTGAASGTASEGTGRAGGVGATGTGADTGTGTATGSSTESRSETGAGNSKGMDTTPGAAAPAASGTTGDMKAGDASDQKETISGWGVKDKIIGKSVYNENDEKVGDVTDVVLTSDGKAAYYVVGAGGFLGMGKHDVAIPFNEIQRSDDRLTLSGYTKDQLKALPQVELAE